MNSLLLCPELFSSEGGIPRILRLYLKAMSEMAQAGDQVAFVTLNDGGIDSVELRRYGGDRLSEWEACGRKRLRFIKAGFRLGLESDLIVCGHIGQLPVAWAAALFRPKLRYILIAHGIEVWRRPTMFERFALKRAHRVFCVSEYTRKEFLRHCRFPAAQAVVVSNALDPYLEPASVTPNENSPPVILTVSRLSIADSYKGIKHLIAAMPAILVAEPQARLRVVGRGDGLRRLQSLARETGVEHSVEFPGYVSDTLLHEEFQHARIFALPSQKEGFGLVYLEAMAHGRPCIGAQDGGIPEVITDETGILVEYGNVRGIGEACIAALSRKWDTQALIDRSRVFSYANLKARLGDELSK